MNIADANKISADADGSSKSREMMEKMMRKMKLIQKQLTETRNKYEQVRNYFSSLLYSFQWSF